MSRIIQLRDIPRGVVTELAADSPLVIPLGATEQHGPHLPVGTDTRIVEEVARRAAELAGGPRTVVLAPALPFGNSEHHLPFGATLSLSSSTLTAAGKELLRSAVASGFRTVLLVNGHGGNSSAMAVAVDAVALEVDATIACASYWACADPEALAEVAGRVPGHAGAFETSLMLAIDDEVVVVENARPSPGHAPPPIRGAHVSTPGFWRAIDGFTDNPTKASIGDGRAMLDALAAGVASVLDEIWSLRPVSGP